MGLTSPAPAAELDRPSGLMLTWREDPTTTMVIDWQTEPRHGEVEMADSRLRYRPEGEKGWMEVEAQSFEFPFSERLVKRAGLTGLRPGTTYEFTAGSFPRTYKFRTMPADLSEPLVFAAGGDTRHNQLWMERMNQIALQYDLGFVVWGGDFAYADGLPERLYRWEEWFDALYKTLITADGRVIPVIACLGNHEVRGGYFTSHEDYQQTDAFRASIAPYFFTLFAFPGQPGFNVLDFGNYLSLVALDSGHTNPYDGLQTEWLVEVLQERQDVAHVIPFYHMPSFPSGRVLQNWVPHFEQYGVQLAFDNHVHIYRRTPFIRNGQEDPSGVMYVGAGAWGVATRPHRVPDPEANWWVAVAEPTRHAIIVTLEPDNWHFETVSEHGRIIDEFPVLRPALTGLESADSFLRFIAILQNDADVERRSTAKALLLLWAESYDPLRPTFRHTFLKKLEDCITADKDPALQAVAYQLLLMHASDKTLPGLLQLGLACPNPAVRGWAKWIQQTGIHSEMGAELLQTLDLDQLNVAREQAFAELTNIDARAFPGDHTVDDYDLVETVRLPATGWKLKTDPERLGHLFGYSDAGFDDSDWKPAVIEADWSESIGTGYVGSGWYRFTFEVPDLPDHDALGLYLTAVDENAWVWIDGEYVGQQNIGHRGYDQPFQLDVSDRVQPGATHQITVRAMNTMGGGGIWQPVELRAYRLKDRNK